MVEARLGPESAQQRDLLLQARRSAAEVDPERVVLHVVPADPDAEPDAPGREEGERGDLLGDQRGLALRQHQDIGHQLEPARPNEGGEEHERLEERVAAVVEAGPVGPGARVRAEDVVVHEQVVVPRVLEPLDEGDDLLRIDAPELRLREDGSESHRAHTDRMETPAVPGAP